jgi:hypothetical protein
MGSRTGGLGKGSRLGTGGGTSVEAVVDCGDGDGILVGAGVAVEAGAAVGATIVVLIVAGALVVSDGSSKVGKVLVSGEIDVELELGVTTSGLVTVIVELSVGAGAATAWSLLSDAEPKVGKSLSPDKVVNASFELDDAEVDPSSVDELGVSSGAGVDVGAGAEATVGALDESGVASGVGVAVEVGAGVGRAVGVDVGAGVGVGAGVAAGVAVGVEATSEVD